MLSLKYKSNGIFMQLIDRLAGDNYLRIKRENDNYLILQLIETGVTINSRNSTGNLYSLIMSNAQDGGNKNPGMQFIVVDNRTGKADADAVAIYPVMYRLDELKTYEEAVEITNHRVYSVNRALQRKHCRFANLWLRAIAANGYLKEYLQKAADTELLFCSCGNTPHLDGFAPCDEFGNEIETPSFEPGYLLCGSCKRIIDVQSYEIIGTKNQSDVSKAASQKLNIDKPLVDMSYAEKAKLLHTLCPEVMRGFISYVFEAATEVINNPDIIKKHWDNEKITIRGWIELATVVKEKISNSFDRLASNSYFFATQLFHGHALNFLMHCLEGYVRNGPNERFNLGVEFIFDI